MGRTTLICQDFPFPVQLIIREKLIRRKGVRFLRSSRPFSIHSRDSGAAVSPRRRVPGLPADDIENGTSWWRATCYDVKWFFPGTAKKNGNGLSTCSLFVNVAFPSITVSGKT